MTETTATPPGELLVTGLLAGLSQSEPGLVRALDRTDLLETCGLLAHLHWTPLMLERWASHPRWELVDPDEFMFQLRLLGLPPEAPRSAVPAPQNVCPECGSAMHGMVCDACLAKRTAGPPPGWRKRGDTAPGGIRIADRGGAA